MAQEKPKRPAPVTGPEDVEKWVPEDAPALADLDFFVRPRDPNMRLAPIEILGGAQAVGAEWVVISTRDLAALIRDSDEKTTLHRFMRNIRNHLDRHGKIPAELEMAIREHLDRE